MTKEKVAWYLEAGQEPTNIELTDNGSNGYKGKWWKKIPDSPELGTIIPVNIFINVVFPAPFGPKRPIIFPF